MSIPLLADKSMAISRAYGVLKVMSYSAASSILGTLSPFSGFSLMLYLISIHDK